LHFSFLFFAGQDRLGIYSNDDKEDDDKEDANKEDDDREDEKLVRIQ